MVYERRLTSWLAALSWGGFGLALFLTIIFDPALSLGIGLSGDNNLEWILKWPIILLALTMLTSIVFWGYEAKPPAIGCGILIGVGIFLWMFPHGW